MICDVLRVNETLEKLSLSSNALGVHSAQSIAALLCHNNTLRELDISCNNFGYGRSHAYVDTCGIATCYQSKTTIRNYRTLPDENIFLSSREDGGKMLCEGIGDNTTIQSMDIRLCHVGNETEVAVREHVRSTELRAVHTKRSGA